MKVIVLVLSTLWPGSANPEIDVIKFSTILECENAKIIILQRAALVSATIQEKLEAKGVRLDTPNTEGICKEIPN